MMVIGIVLSLKGIMDTYKINFSERSLTFHVLVCAEYETMHWNLISKAKVFLLFNVHMN